MRLRRKISRTKRTRGRGWFGHKMFGDIVSCSHTRLSRENRPHVDEIVATAASARMLKHCPYLNKASLNKVLRSANNNDILNMRKADNADSLHLVFEGSSSDRIGEFDLKLMDIDTEHLGIPDTEYDAVVKLSSNEFARICRDLSNVGESVKITITKEGVTFSTEGEIGDARMTLKQGSGSSARLEDDDDIDPLDDEEGDRFSKKRKTSAAGSSTTGAVVPVEIQLEKAVALTFSVQYLVNFTKAAPLSSAVTLHMADKVPLLVEFAFENGHVRYYLAPKLAETDDD